MRAANSHFGKHYINGVWTTPKGAMIDVENPATREIFARVPDGTPEEVDAAVAAAQSAFPRLLSHEASPASISKNVRPHLLRPHGRLPQKKHFPRPSSCVNQ